MTVLMRGVHLVREGVMTYLRDAVPAMAAYAEAQWQEEFQFVLPTKYLPYEALGIEHGSGPIVSMSIPRVAGFVRMDYDEMLAEQYRAVYTVRILMHCFTPDAMTEVPENAREVTIRQRDDLTTLIRSAILDRLSLGQPDVFQVNESTLTEEYSDAVPTPNASGRWIAASALTFSVQFDEGLYRQKIADAESFDIIEGLLPKVGQ